jgi:hypothetical protein
MIPSEWPTCFSSEGVERDKYRLSRQREQGQQGRASPNTGVSSTKPSGRGKGAAAEALLARDSQRAVGPTSHRLRERAANLAQTLGYLDGMRLAP